MRVLFLNQYFPPDPAPTGVLLAEVAEALRADGHEIDGVAARQNYRVGQRLGGRTLRELQALNRMWVDGALRARADVVISATSPPCLLVVAALVAARHRARHIHWAMDVYPQIAVALGEVRGGWLTRAIDALMGWCYRRCEHVVALDADMAEVLRGYGVEPKIIRPWTSAPLAASIPLAEMKPEPPWTWIYSGNLGRAHEWETMLAAQAIIERRDDEMRLLFQGGGPSWKAAQARAGELGLRRCEFRGFVGEAELPATLLRCHATAVTQRPVTRGLLWPSKLALLLALPRPIVWIGPGESAITRLLQPLSQAGTFVPGDAEGVAEWLLRQKSKGSSERARDDCDTAASRSSALAHWCELVGKPPMRDAKKMQPAGVE